MDGVLAGGHRRIDRVLGEGYLSGLRELSLSDVRALRDEADQEETDLSYLRRLLQARLDLVEAELARRAAGGDTPTDLVAYLTAVLTDAGERAPARGLGRHRLHEPTRQGESRREAEALAADPLLTELPARSEEELDEAAAQLRAQEALISQRRKAVQGVFDAVSSELTRRYRDGEADVATLLGSPGSDG